MWPDAQGISVVRERERVMSIEATRMCLATVKARRTRDRVHVAP